jgi:hypothetical protein
MRPSKLSSRSKLPDNSYSACRTPRAWLYHRDVSAKIRTTRSDAKVNYAQTPFAPKPKKFDGPAALSCA